MRPYDWSEDGAFCGPSSPDEPLFATPELDSSLHGDVARGCGLGDAVIALVLLLLIAVVYIIVNALA